MTNTEFRFRSPLAPGGDFRLSLGEGKTKVGARELRRRRAMLRRLAQRGEWPTLQAIKAKLVTIQHVERLIDEYGISDFKAHLDLRAVVSHPSFEDHVARWLTGKTVESTQVAYRKAMHRVLLTMGNREWTSIAPHDITDTRAMLEGRGLAPATVAQTIAACSSFFRWAIEREESEAASQGREPGMVVNPVTKARAWPSVATTRHRFLTEVEFRTWIEVSPEKMKAQYATLVLCGLRIGELLNLPPAHVYLPTHVHIGPWGKWSPKGYPKYNRGVRDIPIHRGGLLPLLEEYDAEWKGDRTFFVNPRTGEPWKYEAFQERFRRDIRAAGLQYGARKGGVLLPNGITPHTPRHTLASWLAQRDVQLMKIAAILGDTYEVVRNHYAHLLPSDLDDTIHRVVLDRDAS